MRRLLLLTALSFSALACKFEAPGRCSSASDCQGGLVCLDGVCGLCSSESDCDGWESCGAAKTCVVDAGRCNAGADCSSWQVCDGVNFSGRCVVLRPGNYPRLSDMGLNDRISSVRMVRAETRPPQPAATLPDAVTFYESDNFRGRTFGTLETVPNFMSFGFNDRASSIVVNSQRWEVCDDVNFGGRCVVLKPGQTVTPDALCRFVNDTAPYFFVPRYVELMTVLPSTPTGRVQKYKLRERGVTPETWDARKAGFVVKR